MRVFILGLILALVLLPTLLILFAQRRTLRARIGWSLVAFLSPILIIGAVQVLPELTNNAPDAHQWGRMLGVVMSGAGFILPWVIFSLFLHTGRSQS